MLKVRTLVKGIVGVALCSVILFFPMAVISWTVEWLTGPRRISGLWWWGAWLAASDLMFWMLHRADRSTGASVTSAAKHLAWLALCVLGGLVVVVVVGVLAGDRLETVWAWVFWPLWALTSGGFGVVVAMKKVKNEAPTVVVIPPPSKG